jgi:flagellar motor switch protein FliN
MPETRMPKKNNARHLAPFSSFEHSSFGFDSGFGFRHWVFTPIVAAANIVPIMFSYVPVLRSQPSADAGAPQGELQRILSIQVPVIVKLAERKLLLSEVMRLGVGAIIEFIKSSDEPLQLLINNKPIAVGEAVKVGENFGLRIKQVGDLKQLIASLAGGSR